MTGGDPQPDEPPRRPTARQNPYVGLVPFCQDDVAWFFGRDREQQIIGANLRSARLTLLYGASGVGKSSVLHAAVVPGLRRVLARDRAMRELDEPDDRKPVRFAVATFSAWRDAPLEGFMNAVAASVAEAADVHVEPWTPGTPLRATFATWLRPVQSLLIVLDQFEEYFLYHPLDDGPGTFAGEFVDVLNDADLRVNFLLSLREDELAKLDRFQGRVPGLFDNYLRVEHLDVDAARNAIGGPLGEYNRRLPDGSAPATIDAELVDEVIHEVRTHEVVAERAPAREGCSSELLAADRVETPLLQLVMQRLWEAASADDDAPHLQLSTLRERLGGTEKIVHRHLRDALDALSDDDRELAVDVLRPLVSPTGTKIAWRAVDLAYWAKRPAEAVEAILRELSSGERRVLRTVMPPPSQGDQSPRYEIFHDILAGPILEWCAEREEERQRAEFARELEAQARAREEAEQEARRRRRRRIWGGVALVMIALSLGAARLALERSELDDSRALAASAVTQLPFDPERSLLLATRAVQRHDTPEAVQALRLSLGLSRVRAVLGSRPARGCTVCAGLETVPDAPNGAVQAPLSMSPDGGTVATVRDGRLRLWRPRSGATFEPAVSTGPPVGAAFTPDAQHLLVVGDHGVSLMAPDGTRGVRLPGDYERGATAPGSRYVVTVGDDGAAVWDVRDRRRVAHLGDAVYLNAAFASAGRVVLQNDLGDLVAWRWRAKRTRRLALGATPAIFNLQYAPVGGFAVDSADAGKARVVAATSGASMALPPGSGADPLEGAYISPDGSRIATVRRATVELWRSERPWTAPAKRVAELVHGDGVTAVAFSNDSKLFATASSDGVTRVWETSIGAIVAELTGHTAGVEALAFSSGGRYLITTAEDLTVRLWDLGLERTLRLEKGVDAIAAGGSGDHVTVAESAGALKLWDARPLSTTPTARRVALPGPRRRGKPDPAGDLHPTSTAVTGDGRSVLVGYATTDGEDGRLALVDLASGRMRVDVAVGGPVERVSVDRRGRIAAVLRGNADGTRVELWDLAAPGGARGVSRVPLADAERITDVAFSPDGRQLLVTSVFGAARIFDLATRFQVHALASGRETRPGPEAFYRGVFSPDGRTVAVAGSRDVRLWDAHSGAERGFRLTGHTSVLTSVAYDATGRWILTSSADGSVRVWDAGDGTPLAVIDRHAGGVNDAAFLSNGWIVSAGADRTVRAYPCLTCGAIDDLVDQARRQATRGLTGRERAEFTG